MAFFKEQWIRAAQKVKRVVPKPKPKPKPKPVFPAIRMVERSTPNQSSRDGRPVTLVVVHDTEGGYEGSVSWLCDQRAQASAHAVLREDGAEVTQLVPWSAKAWACTSYNSVSDNLELAGFAAKPYPVAQLKAAAFIVASRLRARGLPPQHVVPSFVGDPGAHGYTFHSNLGQLGGGHHDPSFSAPQAALFDKLVKQYHAALGAV